MDKLVAKLKEIAKRDCWYDDEEFCPNDYAGGNIDDAYYGGSKDGEAQLARTLLKEFFSEPKS